ncbi:hypothetical protein [Pseudoalteromonas sp. SWYJZ19]|uniref:hypothetical protein n=1 Tax=Pseudoalteromonas sp. SWYJZ19 TaxID=2792068 RepID=UPI0018CDD9EA|nr:hypothetical protein [Pseudoalteromonas sp. SWYJZ19]MBH0049995.1 hypothetical protein [Pseudoalteromonas sp. SWYJZ19]
MFILFVDEVGQSNYYVAIQKHLFYQCFFVFWEAIANNEQQLGNNIIGVGWVE